MFDPKDPFKKIREDHLVLLSRESAARVRRSRDVRGFKVVARERPGQGEGAEPVRDSVIVLDREKNEDDSAVVRAGLVGAVKPLRSRR